MRDGSLEAFVRQASHLDLQPHPTRTSAASTAHRYVLIWFLVVFDLVLDRAYSDFLATLLYHRIFLIATHD